MGYAHQWSMQSSDPAYRHAWPRLVSDARRIVDAVRHHGIVIAGPRGYGAPVVDLDPDITFNGDATSDLDADTFLLHPPPPAIRHHRAGGFCKTNRKPYDLAVAAVLLRCRLLLPDLVAISSHGGWDVEWRHPTPLPGSARTAPSPRDLVQDLFGPMPDTSQLTALPRPWQG